MEKRYWKERAKDAEARAETAEARVSALSGEVRELRREVEDKRKNWAPIKIVHPWTPRDPGCQLCDDPREDPRHVG
jgi:hypothetical protein